MITISEFGDMIVEKLSEKGITSEASEITKNNDVKVYGISIFRKDTNLCPVIYIDDFYRVYSEGDITIDEVVEDILTVNDDVKGDEIDFDLESLNNFEECKDKIVFSLVALKGNEESLKKKVYREKLDLALVYRLMVSTENERTSSLVVTQELLKKWGVTEEDLWNCANENTEKLLPAKYANLMDVIRDELSKSEFAEIFDGESCCEMYVVTNEYMTNGAVVMFYKDILRQIADELDSDLMIIPASIHEIIVSQGDETSINVESVNEMIHTVNISTVRPTERLSDHCYFYKRDTDEVVM